MSNVWPVLPLGELLRHRKHFITIDDMTLYKRCRVQLHAQGIVLRDQVPGSEINTKTQQVCRAGEFLVAEIDAKMGGFGNVPAELDGAIVSSHYFLFEVVEERLDRRFLGWYCKTPAFREQVRAQGTTNYAAIRPAHVLAYTVPVPPLAEQRRIVARLDALAGKVEEAKGLAQRVSMETAGLPRAMLFSAATASRRVSMHQLVRRRPLDVNVATDGHYQFAGVYCFGRGVFRGRKQLGSDFAYKRLCTLRTDDFVYPKLMAWEGALGVVPDSCDGCVVSPEFPVFEIDRARVLPAVLDVYFRSPSVWPQLSGASTGTNVRRRRLNPEDFLRHEMPVPPMPVQNAIQEAASRIALATTTAERRAQLLDSIVLSELRRAFGGAS